MRRSAPPGVAAAAARGSIVVAVAVDGDRNSQYALRWAGDHILMQGQIFYLLHVRRRITSVPTIDGYLPISDVDNEVASTFIEQRNLQTKELLLPFQCFCSRRGLQCKEIILDDIDIVKGIVDFVMHRAVDKLVLGASNRGPIAGAFIRAFGKPDVPTAVSRAAANFCSVYVIAKGSKIVSVRPASRPNNAAGNQNLRYTGEVAPTRNTSFQSVKSEPHSHEIFEGTPRATSDHSYITASSYDDRITDKIRWLDADADESSHSQESSMSCPSPSRATQNNNNNKRMPPSQSSPSLHEIDQDCLSRDDALGDQFTGSMDDLKIELERLKRELKTNSDLSDKFEKEFKPYSRDSSRSDITEDSNDMVITPIRHRKPIAAVVPDNTKDKIKLIEGFTSETSYCRFSMDEIDFATDCFSDKLKIGEGGYGPVYKATLDHTLVAIKALRSDVSTTQGLRQFQQELEVLSSMRHPNMVHLMGACPEYGCLVYEYLSNGSLEDRLACESGTAPLPWQLRFKIAYEIATGLLFLHEQRPEPLVHRDLKPANILLDHNLVAKISDVGLARLIPSMPGGSNSTVYHMTAAAGTFCYIDPEYQKTGMVGTKSDVYALGIIFLQLATGQGPMGLTHSVATALEEGNLADILDKKVPDWPLVETTRLVELGLKCSELRRKDRPDLGSVVMPELTKLVAFAESKHDTPFYMEHHRARSFIERATVTDYSFAETSTSTIKGGASCVL